MAVVGPPVEPAAPVRPQPTVGPSSGRRAWFWRVAPWVVFGLAALLRIGSIDLAAFTYDDADAILRARAITAGDLPTAGALTSWGIPDPPLLIYLLATVVRLPPPALAALVLMALLSACAVLGTYLLAARFFGRECALLAGLLYAVNPWAIYFGRRAWVEVQPGLTVLALWSAFELVDRHRARAGLPFFLSLAAAIQARLLALAYAPAVLASTALGGRAWFSRWSLSGLLAGALLSLPYVAHLAATRERIAEALAAGNRGVAPAPRGSALAFAHWVVSGLNLLPTPPRLAGWLDALGGLLQVESWLAGSLLVLGVVLCLLTCVRRSDGWRRQALLLAWTVLPLGLVAWQSSTVYLHYLVLVIPQLFLLTALPLAALLRGRPMLRCLGVVLFVALSLPQALTWLALERTLQIYDTDEAVEAPFNDRRVLAELARESAQRIGTGEAYGVEVPLRFWLDTAGLTRAELDAAPRELLVVTNGTDPLAEEHPAQLEAVLGPDMRPRYQQADSLVLPIGRPALLLVTSDVEPPVPVDRLGPRRALIPLPTLARGTRDGIRLFDLPARSARVWIQAAGPQSPGRAVSPGRSVDFDAAMKVRVGDPLDVVTYWPGPAGQVRPSVALVDPSGQRVPERDNPRRLALDLAADQLLISRHQIPVPPRAQPGDYRLVVTPVSAGTMGQAIELRTVAVLPP